MVWKIFVVHFVFVEKKDISAFILGHSAHFLGQKNEQRFIKNSPSVFPSASLVLPHMAQLQRQREVEGRMATVAPLFGLLCRLERITLRSQHVLCWPVHNFSSSRFLWILKSLSYTFFFDSIIT